MPLVRQGSESRRKSKRVGIGEIGVRECQGEGDEDAKGSQCQMEGRERGSGDRCFDLGPKEETALDRSRSGIHRSRGYNETGAREGGRTSSSRESKPPTKVASADMGASSGFVGRLRRGAKT